MGMSCLKKGSNTCTMKNKETGTSKWLINGTVNCTKPVRKTKCVNSIPNAAQSATRNASLNITQFEV